MELPIDAEILVPHRKPMLIIDTLNESGSEGCVAEATFEDDSLFVINSSGMIERLALVELIAQSYAAASGYKDLSNSKSPLPGYLVGFSHAVFHGDAYAGQRLIIEVGQEESFDDFYIVIGKVFQQGKMIMEVKLKIWIDSNSERKLRLD